MLLTNSFSAGLDAAVTNLCLSNFLCPILVTFPTAGVRQTLQISIVTSTNSYISYTTPNALITLPAWMVSLRPWIVADINSCLDITLRNSPCLQAADRCAVSVPL